MENVVSQRRKLTIILLVLLLHLLLFLGIFIFYSHDLRDPGFVYDQAMQALAEKQLTQPLTPEEQQQLDEWVTMKARKSDFGTAVIFAEEPEFKSAQAAMHQQATAAAHKEPQQEMKQETHKDTQKHDEEMQELAMLADLAMAKKAEQKKQTEAAQEERRAQAQSVARQSAQQDMGKNGTQDASPAPQVTMADIAKGFIKHLTNDGQYNTAMIGNKEGAPTDQQLKYQRYLQKITWWLNNADRIHNDRLRNIPATKTSVQVTMSLTRDGKLKDIYVRQSSGNAELDAYTLFIFRDASVSFPPVPTYIKEDPFIVTYVVHIFIGERAPGYRLSLN
jgi:TonB family protein